MFSGNKYANSILPHSSAKFLILETQEWLEESEEEDEDEEEEAKGGDEEEDDEEEEESEEEGEEGMYFATVLLILKFIHIYDREKYFDSLFHTHLSNSKPIPGHTHFPLMIKAMIWVRSMR